MVPADRGLSRRDAEPRLALAGSRLQLSPHSHRSQLLSSGRRLQHKADNDSASKLPIFRDAAAAQAVALQEASASCHALPFPMVQVRTVKSKEPGRAGCL